MTDVFSKEKRSEVMSKIRSKGSKMELQFKEEHPEAVVHPDWLPYRPDFLLNGKVVFLDSPFWHGFVSKEKYGKMSEHWQDKLFRNVVRDACADAFYGALGISERIMIG